MGRTDDGDDDGRSQLVKDYKITVEYKHLRTNSPGGVYVLPSLGDLRRWEGVIFVRRGMYSGGIFKFVLELPTSYNDVDAWPEISFASRVFSPYVNETSGKLDLKAAYPRWDPNRHYVVTALTWLKKIFYMKQGFKNYASPANASAAKLYEANPPEFLRRVERCVADSVAASWNDVPPHLIRNSKALDELREAVFNLPAQISTDPYDLLAQSQHPALLESESLPPDLAFADTVFAHIAAAAANSRV